MDFGIIVLFDLYIYEYMKKNNISDIIHIENDVMIYDDLDNIKDIYLSFDNIDRVIPWIMYINNYPLVEPFPIISIDNDENYFDKKY